jgi:glutamyl-tRNA synthetase
MNSEKTPGVRVRFAPSPTGNLHIGGLRTALFNWLFARHNHGAFLLRIEDTDLERSKPEYTQAIIDSFAWVGIKSDEPLVIQSERFGEHARIIQELLKTGKAYRCYCTQEEVAQRHEIAHPGDPYIRYDGHCKILGTAQAAPSESAAYVVRFALPAGRTEVAFDDLICGRVVYAIEQLDDFIIARSDGSPMYNFVVVADDAFMGITHIIRAQEHLANTPKQILLYEACGYAMPQFAHVSLILGPSGEKLSKRDAATSVLDYKKEGYLPEALLNYLARLGWAHGDQEIFTVQELINYFTLDHVSKKGAIFDIAKLRWLNGVYIREKNAQALYDYILEQVNPELGKKLGSWAQNQNLFKIIDLYKERVTTLRELVDILMIVCHGPENIQSYDAQDLATWVPAEKKLLLPEIADALQACAPFALNEIKESVKLVAQKHGLKLVDIAQPIRIALQGNSSGPGVFELLVLLGQQEAVQRIQALYNRIQDHTL